MKELARALLILAELAVVVRSLPADNRETELPFKLYRGYTIVTRGSVAGLKHLNFIIDTGAVPSVVDVKVARKLGLEGQVEPLSLFNETVETRRVTLPGLVLGPIHTGPLSVVVEDLARFESHLGVRVDGMIGLDVLDRQNFVVDYESGTMAFGEGAGNGRAPLDAPETSVPFELGPGYAVVSLDVEGQPLRLMVDTGARSLILFAPRVRGRLGGSHSIGERVIGNAGGTFTLTEFVLPDASLGAVRLTAQKVALMEGQAPASVDLDGLLGVRSLGVRRLGFDFEHRTMTWAR
jgi:predicted aspartyl protease